MYKVFISILLLISSSTALADGIDPDKVIENTIALLVAEKPNDAFDYAMKSNKYASEVKADLDSAKNQLVSFIKQAGNPIGCEKLITRNLIQRIRKDVYLCLSPRQAFEINFEFYRQKESWVVSSFGFSSKADDYMDESIQIEIGKKSTVEQKN
jgi:hypothetical protein